MAESDSVVRRQHYSKCPSGRDARGWLGCLVLATLLNAGCDDDKQAATTPEAPGHRAAALTVLVVDDLPLAAGLELLRGEWAERAGAPLTLEQSSSAELEEADKLEADVVIFPTRLTGLLVARGWLRPVRNSVLKGDTFELTDIFPPVRSGVMTYGGEVIAVSLGSPPLLQCPADSGTATVPRLAAPEYQLALAVIARAVSYHPPQDRASALFDVQKMQPRLTSPPFLRALEEILGQPTSPRVFLGWPGAWEVADGATATWSPLPQQRDYFDSTTGSWRTAEDPQSCTILGVAGRLASVAASSRNATSAFRLLRWLGGGEISTQVGGRSHETAFFRESQAQGASRWLGLQDPATTGVVRDALRKTDAFVLPRVPGIDQYLAAFGEAIQAGSGSAEDVLSEAAKRWESITDRLGREGQLAAYRAHLNLDVAGP